MDRVYRFCNGLLAVSMWLLYGFSFAQGWSGHYDHAAWDVGLALFAGYLLQRNEKRGTTIVNLYADGKLRSVLTFAAPLTAEDVRRFQHEWARTHGR